MPVYKLGPAENGGFRSILPPDPKPPSKAGSVLAYALAIALGLGGCIMICVLIDDQASRSQYNPTAAAPPSV